jgi:hypothetical protein
MYAGCFPFRIGSNISGRDGAVYSVADENPSKHKCVPYEGGVHDYNISIVVPNDNTLTHGISNTSSWMQNFSTCNGIILYSKALLIHGVVTTLNHRTEASEYRHFIVNII